MKHWTEDRIDKMENLLAAAQELCDWFYAPGIEPTQTQKFDHLRDAVAALRSERRAGK